MRNLSIALAMTLATMQASPGMAAEVAADHHAAPTEQQLTLNDGRKWAADKHTVDSVAAMRSTIRQVPRGASAAELHVVGGKLQEQLQTMIRGCTMTGSPHDQLHTWISLLAPEIQNVIKAEQAGAGHTSIANISSLLDSFDAHFEVASSTP